MPNARRPLTPSRLLQRPDTKSALRVSALSVVWTVVASSLAIAIGIRSHTAVLVAFGAIGVVDALGSLALVYHFLRSLRDDRLSEKLERVAHRVVLIGLFSVGCAAVLGGLIRLAIARASHSTDAGVMLVAISFVVLVVLSTAKRQVARRISSNALLSDAHLSAVGAMQAAVALGGTAFARWLGWYWADAAATTLVGSVAAWLAVSTWRTERTQVGRPRPDHAR